MSRWKNPFLQTLRHNRTIDWDRFAPKLEGDIDSASVFMAENLEAEYMRLRIVVKARKETLPLKTPCLSVCAHAVRRYVQPGVKPRDHEYTEATFVYKVLRTSKSDP